MFRVVGFGERVGGMNTTSEAFEPTARVVARHRWLLEQHSLDCRRECLSPGGVPVNREGPSARRSPLDAHPCQHHHGADTEGADRSRRRCSSPRLRPLPRHDTKRRPAFPPHRRLRNNCGCRNRCHERRAPGPVAGPLLHDDRAKSRGRAYQRRPAGVARRGSSHVHRRALRTTRSTIRTFGSFEVGKYADLAVLSEDYLTVPDDRIRRIESVLTLVGGTRGPCRIAICRPAGMNPGVRAGI